MLGDKTVRHLTGGEKNLIAGLLQEIPEHQSTLKFLDDLRVADMDDGGMGSVEFVFGRCGKGRFGRNVVEADYVDADGTPCSISLDEDVDGKLYEISIWKVDFSPLKEYPTMDKVVIRS